MGRKTYLKIVMPSAPTVSFAPYDSQTIGLTTWDEAATIDGVTYHPARFALGEGTSTGDFSKGKGGLALGNQIASLEVENIYSGGLLKNYVDAGTIPLVGAVVTILDGVDATLQTWVLQEPFGDGPVLSFKLCTPGYLNQKRLQFPASSYGETVTVGLVVGDNEVNEIGDFGRYKGVNVSTRSQKTSQKLYRYRYYNNLGSPDSIIKNGIISKESADSFSGSTYEFEFINQNARDVFYSTYFSADGTQIKNASIIITDGTSSEVICWINDSGGKEFNITPIKSTTNQTALDVMIHLSELSTDPASVYLAISYVENPICCGGQKVVGFASKNKDKNEYGVTLPEGTSLRKNNILYFLPRWVSGDSFLSWSDILGCKISWDNYSEYNREWTAEGTGFFGNTANIVTDASKDTLDFNHAPPFYYLINAGALNRSLQLSLDFHASLVDADVPVNFEKIYLDVHSHIIGTPRGSTEFKWPNFFQSTNDVTTESGFEYRTTLRGKQLSLPSFDSFENLNNHTGVIQVKPPASDYDAGIYVGIYAMCFYAFTKLSFGSDPIIVVPGDFPGTDNLTLTPLHAAIQLAAWLGFADVSLTGGITPTRGTWGEYLGEDPSSTSSDDTTSAKDRLSSLLQEACIYGAETGGTVALPDVEVAEHPSTPSSSIDDVVTMPQFTYCYAGTSAQFTAKVLNVDETFDISKGDGYYWGGWQEKDACHVSQPASTTNVSSILAVGDLLFANTSDAKLMRSPDGGDTWQFACASTLGLLVDVSGSIYVFERESGYSHSPDGYSWTSHTWGDGRTIYGAWYDATTGRLWCCGKDANNIGSAWYTTDGGSNWTLIWPTVGGNGIAGAIEDIRAVGNKLLVSYQHAVNGWTIATSTDLGESGTAYAWQPLSMPFLSYWDKKFRVAWGAHLYSSSDLLTFTDSAIPLAATNFATDGKGVVWGVGADDYYRTIYSRDNGATWKIIPFAVDSGMPCLAVIWDANAWTFRVSNYRPQVMSLGDPSLLDIWLRCREAYLATSTLATDTFDKRGLYDASELVRWLLDCKDGTDTEYQQPFIKWITRPARFVIVRGRYQSIVDQLSVAAGLPITIPRKMLTYSGYDQNLPTRGIISNATHTLSGTDAGLSEIEIIMPPL